MLSRPSKSISHSSVSAATVTLLALTLSACAFQKDPKSAENTKINELEKQLDANRALVKSDFKHTFFAGENPNVYTARVTWPVRPLLIKIFQNKQLIKTFDARTETSFEGSCIANKFEYVVQVVSPQTGILGDMAFQEKCPFDYVVERDFGDVEILKRTDGRLFLGNGSLIALGKESLDLTLREIVINGSATIRTYRPDRDYRLNEDLNTKHAPTIRIYAGKISGLLNLELNGVDGASVGDLPDEVDTALNGLPGTDGQLGSKCGEPRKLGDGVQVCRDLCSVSPTSGTKGRDAITKLADGRLAKAKGIGGLNGIRGIGTSEVTIDVQDFEQLSLHIDFNPGLASVPGLGSLPRGGLGGPAGKNPGAPCPSATTGARGSDGERGPPGKPASNGSCGVIQLPAGLGAKTKFKDSNLECSKVPGTIRNL